MLKRIALIAAAVTGSVALAAPATAAPVKAPGAELITLECDNGRTYDTVVGPGNGDWVPAHILNGKGILKPFGFTNLRGEARFPDGHVERFSDPGYVKRNARNHDLVRCDFHIPFADPDGTTGFYAGTVLVKISGGGRR